MIRVLEVISDANIGGAGRLLVNKIKYSDKSRFEYIVALPKDSSLIPLLKEAGANVIQIKACENKSLDIKGFFALRNIIKKLSPDILNSHACMSARLAGKFSSIMVNIYTRHCDFPVNGIFNFSVIRSIYGAFDNYLNDGVIAVSYSAKKNLLALGVKADNIKVIINGADKLDELSVEKRQKIRAGLKIPADAFVISIFARLEAYKDHKTFLRAAKALKKNKNMYFLVVGDGSCANELKGYSEKLGIDDHVRFLGFVDDISKIMNITDVNVNCSVGTETSSLALSEGMSVGVPAIASDYDGNKYMVNDGINGFIFPQRDYVRLANAILCLYRNKTLYNLFSENARKRFECELNAMRMTKETEMLYISKLNEAKGLMKIRNRCN